MCAGGDLQTMAATEVALLEKSDAHPATAENARAYVADTHAADKVGATFEDLVTAARPPACG